MISLKAVIPMLLVSLMLFGCCITGPPTITTPTPEPAASPTATPAPEASPTATPISTPAFIPTPREGCGPIITSCGCYVYAPGNYTLGANLTCDWGMSFYGSASGSVLDCGGHSLTALGNESGNGISIFGTDGVEVRNCIISNFYECISATSARGVVIAHNTITGCPNGGINFWNVSNSQVSANIADLSTNGIYALNCSGVNITGNTVNGNSFTGIQVGGSDNLLHGNGISGSQTCARVYSCSNCEIQNTNAMYCGTGISMESLTGTAFRHNTVSSSSRGFDMVNTTGSTLEGNNFTSTEVGVRCQGSGSNIDAGGNTCPANDGCGWLRCP